MAVLKRALLAEERRKEREFQQMLEKQEEINLGLNQSFPNLQQEVDFKTKKLKKYFAKLQALKQEIKDLNETNSKQRQELEQNQTDLLRDIKLRQLIIDNFIPKDEKEKLITRLYYDPDEDRWKPKSLTKEKLVDLFDYSSFKPVITYVFTIVLIRSRSYRWQKDPFPHME